MLNSKPFASRLSAAPVLFLVLAFSLAAAGCGSDRPVGGLTNPNAGSVVDRDKGGVRNDLPVPDLNADQKEPIAEAAASSTSGTGTAAGTGAHACVLG